MKIQQFLQLFFALGILLVIIAPLEFLQYENDTLWGVFSKNIPQYTLNTILLIAGVLGVSCLIAIPPAYYLGRYEVRHKKWWVVLLILPLAIPSYINAFIYTGILDSTGTITSIARTLGFSGTNIDPYQFWILVLVLSLVLYPYIFLSTYLGTRALSNNIFSNLTLLQRSGLQKWLKVLFPLLRPAIFSGAALVSFEVLNEYGAVKLFNFKTLVAGVFEAWNLGIINAMKISSIILTFIFLGVIISLFIKANQNAKSTAFQRQNAPKNVARNLKLYSSFLFLFAFLIPISQLFYWSCLEDFKYWNETLWSATGSSIKLALLTVVFLLVIGLILDYSRFEYQNKLLLRISSLGYSVPGVVIALGLYGIFLSFDKQLVGAGFDKWFTTGSFALVTSYIIRFLIIPINNYGKISQALGEHYKTSKVLNISSSKFFRRVYLPNQLPAMVLICLVIAIDVLKELPATLILLPPNTKTLAVEAFKAASITESAIAASPASLMIISTSILFMLIINRLRPYA